MNLINKENLKLIRSHLLLKYIKSYTKKLLLIYIENCSLTFSTKEITSLQKNYKFVNCSFTRITRTKESFQIHYFK